MDQSPKIYTGVCINCGQTMKHNGKSTLVAHYSHQGCAKALQLALQAAEERAALLQDVTDTVLYFSEKEGGCLLCASEWPTHGAECALFEYDAKVAQKQEQEQEGATLTLPSGTLVAGKYARVK